MGELFRRNYTLSIAVARRFLPLKDESSDAVQSAYLLACRNFDSFRGESSFRTWMRRIVINECLMRLRRQGRHQTVHSVDAIDDVSNRMSLSSGPTTPEQLLFRREIRKAFSEATDRLPASWREVITRCALSGISVSEMAQALGLSLAATKSRLFRARSQMRTDLACFHNSDL